MNKLQPFRGIYPTLGQNVYIHPSAQVIGQVELANEVSIWCGAVLRGDVNRIKIGEQSNIQDLSIVHVTHQRDSDPEGAPVIIGARVTVGHGVMLHGCTIGDECLIGMGSIVLDNVVIEPQVLLGAGSLVPPNKILKSGWLYMGRPAQPIRPLTSAEVAHFAYSAAHYAKLQAVYRAENS